MDEIINEVVNLMGKEGCIKMYESQKRDFPKFYDYGCQLLGRDIIECINSL